MPRNVDGATEEAITRLQQGVDSDPDIQAILTREKARLAQTHDKGGADRDYQKNVRAQITEIAKQKGYIPKEGQYFINPNDGQLEPHGGWSGLSNKTRAAIIAAAGVATWGATGFAGAGALGFGGGGGGAGALTGTTGSTVLPSSSLATGAFTAPTVASMGVSAGIPAATTATTTAATTGGLGFLKSAATNPDVWRAGADALGSHANTSANNRDAQLSAQYDNARLGLEREGLESQRDRDFQAQTIAREQEGRASGSDAWRKLMSSQHTLSPGARPQLSPYSVAPRQATDVERTGATAMSEEVMKRLQGGNAMPQVMRRPGLPTDMGMDMSLTQPGRAERAFGWLGTGARIYGAYQGGR